MMPLVSHIHGLLRGLVIGLSKPPNRDHWQVPSTLPHPSPRPQGTQRALAREPEHSHWPPATEEHDKGGNWEQTASRPDQHPLAKGWLLKSSSNSQKMERMIMKSLRMMSVNNEQSSQFCKCYHRCGTMDSSKFKGCLKGEKQVILEILLLWWTFLYCVKTSMAFMIFNVEMKMKYRRNFPLFCAKVWWMHTSIVRVHA